MTQEEFIKVLEEEGYSYEIEGDNIVVLERGGVDLDSLKSLPPGVEFRNGDDVNLYSIIGGWFFEWKGNIEDIDSKSLLNLMISKGVFER